MFGADQLNDRGWSQVLGYPGSKGQNPGTYEIYVGTNAPRGGGQSNATRNGNVCARYRNCASLRLKMLRGPLRAHMEAIMDS